MAKGRPFYMERWIDNVMFMPSATRMDGVDIYIDPWLPPWKKVWVWNRFVMEMKRQGVVTGAPRV